METGETSAIDGIIILPIGINPLPQLLEARIERVSHLVVVGGCNFAEPFLCRHQGCYALCIPEPPQLELNVPID